MTPDARPEPDTPARTKRAGAGWLLPPAASLAIHAGLLIGLTAVTIEVTRERPAERPRRVTLAAPTQPPPQSSDLPEPAEPSTGTPDAAQPIAIPEPGALAQALTDTARAPVRRTTAPAPAAPAPVAESILSPDNASVPRVRFGEIEAAPARTVVFVVDASGAVATAFTFVREELLRSIDQLSPTQRFQVVVFPGPENTDPVLAPINNGKLALASPASKRAVAEWMTTFRPRGRSAPLAGLRTALALEPDVTLLITRSIERTGPVTAWGDGMQATLEELDRLNPVLARTNQRRTAIAAVQLLDEDPTGIMPAIAAIHGSGLTDYRVVTADTLASPEPPRPRPSDGGQTDAIDAAAAILAELDDAGTALRLFQGVPSAADRDAAKDKAEAAAALAARVPDDPRARVLLARARTLTSDPALTEAAITTLRAELLHDPDADAWRRLALADALAQRGQTSEALAELNDLRADVAQVPVSPGVERRMAATGVALGEDADLDAMLDAPPFSDGREPADAYWVLALAEARSRALVRAGGSDAYAPLMTLLERAERERADGWVPILLERLVSLAELAPELVVDAPSRVRLAVAEAWARTPATRAHAHDLLATLAQPDTPERPEALWRLGVLERSLDTEVSRANAAEYLAALATDHPEHPRAPDALAAAIALTTDTGARLALLRLGVERLPDRPEADLWRLDLAAILAPTDPIGAMDALEPVSPGTRESTLARERYRTAATVAIEAADGRAQSVLIERAALFLDRHQSPDAPAWLTRAADATLAGDPKRSLSLARRSVEASDAQGRANTQGRLALARAQIALGQRSQAAAGLSELAQRLDRAGDRSASFWNAWTLLLEAAADGDPDAARAHIARLALIDPDLGSEPWRSRLRTIERRLATP